MEEFLDLKNNRMVPRIEVKNYRPVCVFLNQQTLKKMQRLNDNQQIAELLPIIANDI